MDSITYVDELLKEYFIFRGYIKTFTSFHSEKINDKLDGPDVGVIMDSILLYIRHLNFHDFLELWNALSLRFFIHLSPEYHATITLVELNIKRAFLIKAKRMNSMEKLNEIYAHIKNINKVHEFQQWFCKSRKQIKTKERE